MDWKDYESDVASVVRAQMGEERATVYFDHRVTGVKSGRPRQVDIYVRGQFEAFPGNPDASIAIDCKKRGRDALDIMEADRFVGCIEDIGANMGIIVTNGEPGEGAMARIAQSPHLQIVAMTFERLQNGWTPYISQCETCVDALPEDAMPGAVYRDLLDEESALDKTTSLRLQGLGACTKCATVYVWCRCGVAFPLVEWDEGEWLSCRGCHVEVKLDALRYDRDAIPENELPNERVWARGQHHRPAG